MEESRRNPPHRLERFGAPGFSRTLRAGFVELGKLKGTDGDQNYEVPADLDLGKYRAVTIWCRRFGVNFGTAPLTPAS